MDDWTRVLLYGYFDGFGWSTDGDGNILLVLDNGDKVEIPSHFVKNASDFVEKNQIKLKDVIARIKQLDIGTRKVWLDEFLNELDSDYGTLKYKAGYEQGKLEGEWVGQQLKDADKIRQELNKPVIPQFVADWIKYCKNTGVTLVRALMVEEIDLYNYANQKDSEKLKAFLRVKENQETFARAWLDGYEVEKEKQYEVLLCNGQSLKTVYRQGGDRLDFEKVYGDLERFTRKQLEDAGLGWAFDCQGIEIREVAE